MQHSAFDLEVYAKTVQANIGREVEKSRKLDEATHRWHMSGGGATRSFSRVFARVRSWLTARRAVEAAPDHAAPARSPRPAATRPIRAAEPYAGMVVVARAAAIPIAERPCGVGER